MSKNFLTAFVIGIVVIAIGVAGLLYLNRGARTGLDGQILKVRTAPLDENSSVAVLDFRIHNPADDTFVVRTVTVVMQDPNGQEYSGATVSETDAKALFQYVPLLGQKFNPTLVMRDKIPSGATEDRMIAVRFNAPEARIDARKQFVLKIEDLNGPVTEIPEHPL
jgi:hypothetical protein